MATIATATNRWTWRRLLRWAGLADVAVMAFAGIALRDPEALVFAGIVGVGIAMLRFRGGLAGVVILGVLSADAAFFMLPAFASNAAHRESLANILIPASLAVVSLTGVAAALGSLSSKHPSGAGRVAGLIPQVVLATFVLAVIAAVVQQRGDAVALPQPGDVMLEVGSIAFKPSKLDLPTGPTTFAMHNTDLFWHTFTIEALDLNVDTPIGARRRASITLPAGTFTYICRVPGHAAAGMKGTLVVR